MEAYEKVGYPAEKSCLKYKHSQVRIQIPILPEAIEYAKMGMMPGGTFKNKEFRPGMIEFSPGLDALIRDLLFDPQTSGGLMICGKREQADALVSKLIDEGVAASKIIIFQG